MAKPRALSRVFQEQAKFLYNQEKPNAWHCTLLRASAPRGSSFTIEFPEWNDKAFIIRSRDLGKHKTIKLFHDLVPMFADGVVDYDGQPLALLVGPDQEFVANMEREVVITYVRPEEVDEEKTEFASRVIESGDMSLLEQCPRIVESSIAGDGFFKLHFEPRGAIAEWKSDMLWVQCSTSWPHLVRRAVSESTGLAQKNITVISQPSSYLPDRFMVDSTMLACYASMAALTCMKQVQLFLGSKEDIHYATRQPYMSARIRSGHTEDGRIIAIEAAIDLDSGAFPIASKESIEYCLAGLCETYRCQNQLLSVRVMKTAEAPRLAGSLFGLSAVQQALEQHANHVTTELGLDVLAWRVQNLLAKADATPYGPHLEHSANAYQVLQEVAKKADLRRKQASFELLRKIRAGKELRHGEHLSGIGLALGFQGNGLMTGTELAVRPRMRLRLAEDGHLEISCPMYAVNTGLRDAWLAAVEELLGIEERNISFSRFSTDQIDDSGPARFSRISSLYSPLLATGCKMLKQRMGKGAVEVKLSMQNVRKLSWDEDNFTGSPFLGRSWAAAAVELTIDPQILLPVVKQVWLAVNAGSILNPEYAERSIRQSVLDYLEWFDGSYAFGKGHVLPLSGVHATRPKVEIELINTGKTQSVEQKLAHAGGIGELAHATIPAAYANAVSQALGRPVERLPITSRDIFTMLGRGTEKETEEASEQKVEA